MDGKQEQEKAYESISDSGEKVLHLEVLLKALIQKCLGKALDYGRMSGMTDRNFKQFERTIKDDFYKVIDDGILLLKEYGYIKDDHSE